MDKEVLNFTQKAMEVMGKNPTTLFYEDEKEGLFAVRWGFGNDCLKVFKVEELLFVDNFMDSVRLETRVLKDNEERKK